MFDQKRSLYIGMCNDNDGEPINIGCIILRLGIVGNDN